MALATLSIDIEARLAKLEDGMSKAVRLSEKTATAITTRWSKLDAIGANFAAGLISAFGALSVAGGVRAFAGIIEGVDGLNDLKDATGASIENISALEDIAARTGTSFDTVGTALVRFNAELKDADGKNAASQSIAAIGLSVEELKRLDPAEALRRVAVALDAYADDGNKARVVQELFGKSVREVAPLLKDLAGAGELNATVTTAQAEAAERFVNQLNALRKNISDMTRSLLGEAIPAVNRFIETWQKLGGISGITDSNQTQRLAREAGAEARTLGAQIERNQRLIDQGGGAADPRNAKAVKMLELMRARLDDINARATAYAEKLKQIGDNVRGVAPSLAGSVADLEADAQGRPSLSAPPPPPSAARARAARPDIQGPAIPDDLAEALKRLEGTDERKLSKLNDELARLLQIQSYDPARAGLTQAITTVREEIDKLDPAAKKMADALREIDALFGQTGSGQAADLTRQLDLAAQALEFGAITAERYGAVVDELYRRLDAVNKKGLSEGAVKAIDQLDARWERFGANVQDTFAQAFENGFSGAGRAFEKLLKRMLAQAAAAKIGDVLFGDVFRANGGSNTGLIGAFLGAIGGGGSGLTVDTGGIPINGPGGGVTQKQGFTYAPNIVVQGGSNRSEVYAAATKAARDSQQQFVDAVQRGLITLPAATG